MSEPHSLLTEARVRAPQLPADPACWLNTNGKAVTLAQLRGSVVLLDFWTYGCINCLHILPDLKYLEAKYAARPFVVIGIHSGKFDNERDCASVANAVRRLDIQHPVACDNDHRVWDEYDIHAWPTIGIIDPEGYYLGSLSGEGHGEELDQIVGQLLTTYANAGRPTHLPFLTPLGKDLQAAPLSFPGKILADGLGQRLFVADTGHNRIVVCDLEGRGAQTFGNGEAGRTDGGSREARFCRPQGMALIGDALTVCDSGNHVLRRVDLADQTVTTVAGTGAQANARPSGGPGPATPLASPWDICYHHNDEGVLTLAMAGSHQLWRYDLRSAEVQPYAGNGRESCINGALKTSAFAQPSGVAADEHALYVADSESSSLRRIRVSPDTGEEVVETLIGGGLYTWGDTDGEGDSACLQHPMGICAYRGLIYIADTYNHKIKVFDPVTGSVQTLAGTGKPGMANGFGSAAQFNEPNGLSGANGNLYIADTNNHCLRVFHLETGIVSTLELPEICACS